MSWEDTDSDEGLTDKQSKKRWEIVDRIKSLESKLAQVEKERDRIKNLLEMSELTRKADMLQRDKFRKALQSAKGYIIQRQHVGQDAMAIIEEISSALADGKEPPK